MTDRNDPIDHITLRVHIPDEILATSDTEIREAKIDTLRAQVRGIIYKEVMRGGGLRRRTRTVRVDDINPSEETSDEAEKIELRIKKRERPSSQTPLPGDELELSTHLHRLKLFLKIAGLQFELNEVTKKYPLRFITRPERKKVMPQLIAQAKRRVQKKLRRRTISRLDRISLLDELCAFPDNPSTNNSFQFTSPRLRHYFCCALRDLIFEYRDEDNKGFGPYEIHPSFETIHLEFRDAVSIETKESFQKE